MKTAPPPHPRLLDDVEKYYTAKLAEHGATPLGVDWNGDASQTLRFEQLAKLIMPDTDISANDIGCGYGAMFAYLTQLRDQIDYHGCDVSANMVEAARQKFGNDRRASFIADARPHRVADYGFASGIFNVRLTHADSDWQAYMTATLDVIADTSSLGFAFNCLTAYSDADKMRPNLYYASPTEIFDLCKRRYSRNVALLHDYGLYEFTVIVRKVE